jgi:hypothetical protein
MLTGTQSCYSFSAPSTNNCLVLERKIQRAQLFMSISLMVLNKVSINPIKEFLCAVESRA